MDWTVTAKPRAYQGVGMHQAWIVEVTTPETGRRFLSHLPDVWRPDPEHAHVFTDLPEAQEHARRQAYRDFQPIVVPTWMHPLFQHRLPRVGAAAMS